MPLHFLQLIIENNKIETPITNKITIPKIFDNLQSFEHIESTSLDKIHKLLANITTFMYYITNKEFNANSNL